MTAYIVTNLFIYMYIISTAYIVTKYPLRPSKLAA